MELKKYETEALKTASDFTTDTIMTPHEAKILNGALGLAGESGEVADYIKKWIFQGHAFNPDYVLDELGDIMWYINLMCVSLGSSVEEVLDLNIKKLRYRYPNGHFEVEKSVNRDV